MAVAYRDWTLLPDDITRDIFARLQPDDHLFFFRVSHLCKGWHRALSDPDFACRLHERNVAPLLFGFLHDRDDDDEEDEDEEEDLPPFFSTVPSPFSPRGVPDRSHWKVLDYRHGRALFMSKDNGVLGRKDLLIWDPITGLQLRVPVAPQASQSSYPGAAFVCVAPGCNHRLGCNGGEFQVALVFADDYECDEDEPQTKCCLYSSQSDTWGEVATFHGLAEYFGEKPSVLAGDSLYFLSNGFVMFEFDISANTLSEIPSLDMEDFWYRDSNVILVHDENRGISIVEATKGNIFVWSRKTKGDGDVSWSLTKTFDHYDLHGTIGIHDPYLLGFVEGSAVIFVATSEGTFTFDLTSGLAKMVVEEDLFNFVLPVVNLCAPLNGLQQIQVAGHLFIKGWNDVEIRDFDSAVQCFRDCLEIRTRHYGKFAPECASTYYRYGCALLYKAQELADLADEEGEHLSLSMEMLEIARLIVEKNPDSTLGIAEIVSALTEVLMQMEKKRAMLTKSTEAKTEIVKRANVIATSPETPRKRHQKAVDSVATDKSSDDSGMHSPTQPDY